MPWLCKCTPEGECGIWKSTSAEANGWRGRRRRCRNWAKVEGLAEQDRGCAEGKAQLHSFITLHLSQFLRGKNDSLSLSLSLYRSDERVSANLLVYIRDSTLCCDPRRPDAQPDGSPQDPQPAASQHNASHHRPGVYAVLTANQAFFDFLRHGSQQAKPTCE